MTIQLKASIFIAGVHQAAGTSLTLGADVEAELVNRGVAVYTSRTLTPQEGWYPAMFNRAANNKTILEGADGRYAAIPADSNGHAILVGGGGHLRDNAATRQGLGDTLFKYEVAPSPLLVAGYITDLSVMSPDPDDFSRVIRIDGDGLRGSNATYTPPVAVDMTGVTSIGFWAMAKARPSGESAIECNILFVSTAWTVLGTATFAVVADGAWHFYVMAADNIDGTGGWVINSAQVKVKFGESTAASGRTAMAVGESVWFGPIRKNVRGKAVGMIRFDDNQTTLYTVKTAVAEYVGQSGVTIAAGNYTVQELVSAFGFKATCYLVTDLIGRPGFETAATLRTLQDSFGWDMAFQSKYNPIGYNNSGVRMLGPIGYSMLPVGQIASVDTALNTITCSKRHGVSVVGTAAGNVQAFPVEFIGSDLPAPLVTGTKYWLSDYNAPTGTIFRVHTTPEGSATGTDIVDLTTAGTAANFGVRYWGSTNDYTGILADFVNGQTDMRNMGFKAYDHYAMNQGAWDMYSEQAAIEVGFKTAWTTAIRGIRVANFLCATNMVGNAVTTDFDPHGATNAPWINIPTAYQTDGTGSTDADARAYVRNLVAYGRVGGNYHHNLTTANAVFLIAYLDELKVQSDRGLLDVMTITEFQTRAEASV